MPTLDTLNYIEKHFYDDVKALENTNQDLYCAVLYLVTEIIRLNLNLEDIDLSLAEQYIHTISIDATDLASPVVYCNTLQYLQDKWRLCSGEETSLVDVTITKPNGETVVFPFIKQMIYVEDGLISHITQRVKDLAGEEGLNFFNAQLEEGHKDDEVENIKNQIKAICNREDEDV
jgi:hypothetical protein